jgi:hypothetical protein
MDRLPMLGLFKTPFIDVQPKSDTDRNTSIKQVKYRKCPRLPCHLQLSSGAGVRVVSTDHPRAIYQSKGSDKFLVKFQGFL